MMTFIKLMDPLDFWIRSDFFNYVLLMVFPLAIVLLCISLIKEVLDLR